jgi:hypothetical protein
MVHLRRFSPAFIFVLGILALAVGSGAGFASPTTVPAPTAKVDCVVYDEAQNKCTVVGIVYAIAQVGDRTYIGGSFASVAGQPRANVAAIRADGTLDETWKPSTDGIVYALAASSDGSKIFMGGTFTTVNGSARRLAAVTADTGALVPGWNTTTSNNTVRALVADGGDRLYVGGNFSRIGGKGIARLAAVSQTTGAVDTSFHPQPNNTVRALDLSDDGQKLYAGGSFNTVAALPRWGAAELTTAGAVTSFSPSESGVVISLDVSPTGRLFFGTTNNRTWAYDPDGDNLPEYRVRTSGDVQAILATEDEVYVGGHFSSFPEAKQNRLHIGSFLAANGTVTAWNPGANGSYGVWAFGLTRTPLSPNAVPALSVGGDFTRTGGVARRGYARFLF